MCVPSFATNWAVIGIIDKNNIIKWDNNIREYMADFLQQLAEQKRKVDFNTYDMTTKELVSLVADGTINISPGVSETI